MANRKSELEDHIATLEDFETRYGEFLVERRNLDHDWSGEEWAKRERELKELAPQAEGAMVAAGEKRWDGGPVRIDLPSRILAFVDEGDGIDDTEQWKILDGIPTSIGALKGKLKRASGVPDMSLKDWDAELAKSDTEVRSIQAPHPFRPYLSQSVGRGGTSRTRGCSALS